MSTLGGGTSSPTSLALWFALIGVLLLGTLTACAPHGQGVSPSPARLDGVSHCDYRVRALSASPLVLDVTATCRGRGVRGLEADQTRIAEAVGSVTSDGKVTTRNGPAFLLSQPQGSATFNYRIDLDRMAAAKPSIDRALRSGASLLAPAWNFLLYPLPLDVGIDIDLRVETPPGMEFVSGITRVGDHFHLQAHEIPVATYSAFGTLQRRRITLEGDPAEVELAVLDGELDVDLETLAAWVKERAQAVGAFYGGFPSSHTLVVVVPVPKRRDVVFGKLLPESAPGVALLVGSAADKTALHDDWVLVHELFHIGVPSFFREGKWFDEGLATYFEPIIRVRAGLFDELGFWRDFATEMPRALPALTRDGLEHTRNYTGLYWGGAIYCLLADVAARSASQGRLGLEDGVRRVLRAGGRAWEVWPLEKTLRTADGVFENPVLAPLAARYAETPAPLDLDALLRSLGVERSASGVTLSDSAPLAWVRRAILTPTLR
ncbi:MAG TPA: hypothetical protein VG937_13535 [Polyangiaceae bacterium]|jgi:hypothetical protein|nr:hypothetical protein [Polyangiaceae bacterium]